jgi:hypothetical protein
MVAYFCTSDVRLGRHKTMERAVLRWVGWERNLGQRGEEIKVRRGEEKEEEA